MGGGDGPRIADGGWRDVGPAAFLFARVAGRVTGTRPPHLFLILGRTRGLFWGWLHFAGRLMPGGRLPRRESELVILRVANLRGSGYELAHHQRLGRRAGLTEEEITRTAEGPGATGWSARERVLLQAVDELDRAGDITDATWAELRAHLDERRAIELCLLAGHYEMLATVIHTLRMAPDEPRS